MLSLYIVSGKVTDVKKKRFYKYGRNLHHKPELIIEPVLIMAYNNREMKRIILPSLLACLLAATASLSCSMEPGPYRETIQSPIEGTLYIDLPTTVPYTFQEAGLYGDVQILVGKQEVTVDHSVIMYDFVQHRLEIPLSVTVNFDGVAVITCVSRLSYAEPVTEEEAAEAGEEPGDEQSGGTDTPEEPVVEDEPAAEEEPADSTPIPYAGYLITSLTKDRTNRINDTDHDGTVSDPEQKTMPLLPALRFYNDPAETDPVKAETTPEIVEFASSMQYTTPDLSITISGTVSSLEWALVYARINNQYQWLETAQDLFTPDRVVFPEGEEDPFVIPLKPGINEIELIAVNSQGYTFSDIITVDCTAQLVAEKENILVTLTWDTLADLDLHTWYYLPEEDKFIWHNSYFMPDAPDTDDIKNLDMDNKTGFGPEHFTLLGAPDGYYIIAVNAHSLADLPAANAFVSIETNERLHSLGPFRITEENSDDYPVNNNLSWARIADIRITEGVAEILDPDRDLDPPDSITSTIPSVAQTRSVKHALKFR
jgi:hypothetical protein